MASIEYSSTDTGAPQMAGNVPGSLLGVLKAVLVNGYGDKQPLGWELMFEDTAAYVAVYRPREGSRMFLCISDNTAVHQNSHGCFAKAIAYESMFSPQHGIHPCPLLQDYDNGVCGYIYKTVQNNNLAKQWKIIGDSCGFYLITFPMSDRTVSYNMRGSVAYFGDYITILANTISNKYNWITWTKGADKFGGSKEGAGNAIMRNGLTQLKGAKYAMMDSAGSFIRAASGATASGADIFYNSNKIPYNNYANNLPVYCQYRLGHDGAYFGAMPGLFEPLTGQDYKRDLIYYDAMDENNTMISIPTAIGRGYAIDYASYYGRISILIGERFRYAF